MKNIGAIFFQNFNSWTLFWK